MYHSKVKEGVLAADPAQASTVSALTALYDQISDYRPQSKWLLSGLFGVAPKRPKGLYIYGGVGRGKSMLMDMFFETVSLAKKRRVHFHSFMQEVHAALHEARKSGVEDAIRPVAENVIASTTLLCLDEMQISDITDAMLVGRLFEFLIDAGLIIVTTSNRPPDDLYKDGLNRDLFLPFIDLINTHLVVHNLDSDTDYRLGRLANATTYFTPITDQSRIELEELWISLTNGQAEKYILSHKGRDIIIPAYYNGIARGRFDEFCERPLGPGDYLKIAEFCRVIFITDIPVLNKEKNNEAKRFVTFIDALYEAKVKVIASADASPKKLYEAGSGSFEFERTASRLYEMQSDDWAI